MRKRRERSKSFISVIGVLSIFLLLSVSAEANVESAEANAGDVQARVLVNTGKLLVTTPRGEKVVYEKAGEDLLITPQTSLMSLTGTCVVKVGNAHLVLDAGDSLSYESQKDLQFKCLTGSIEAVSGERTVKLRHGEMVALNSMSDNVGGQEVVSRARLAGERFSGLKDSPITPFQGGPYTVKMPWPAPYAQQSQWMSPYW